MFRRTIMNHPPTGQWRVAIVYHIHVHVAAHLVLEDDDVLQAHDLLATHQVPQKNPREQRQSFPNHLTPRRYRGQMLGGLGLWAGFVACDRVAEFKSLPPLPSEFPLQYFNFWQICSSRFVFGGVLKFKMVPLIINLINVLFHDD